MLRSIILSVSAAYRTYISSHECKSYITSLRYCCGLHATSLTPAFVLTPCQIHSPPDQKTLNFAFLSTRMKANGDTLFTPRIHLTEPHLEPLLLIMSPDKLVQENYEIWMAIFAQVSCYSPT